MALLTPLGCSTSLGPVASRTFAHRNEQYVGVSTQGIVEVPVLYSKTSLAIGWESRLVQRTSSGGTSWGDWRLNGLLGVSRLPRPHEMRVGYEMFLTPGLARYQAANRPDVGFTLGLLLAAPVRLGKQLPRWRSDQLLAVQLYLVPTAGVDTLAFHELEVSGGLAVRGTFWSATVP